MKKKYLLLSILCFCLTSISLFAQEPSKKEKLEEELEELEDDFEKERRRQNEEFEKDKERFEDDFQKVKAKMDKEFEEFLKEDWRKCEPKKETPQEDPKPEDNPTIEEEVITPPAAIIIKPVLVPIIVQPEITTPQIKPIPIPTQPVENHKFTKFQYFLSLLSVYYPQNLQIHISQTIGQAYILQYWDKASKTNYIEFVGQLLKYRQEMGLSDWDYYQLIKSLAEQVNEQDMINTRLMTWFILLQSGYDTKVGFNNNEIFLLLPSQQTMYEKTYYNIDQKRYYVIDAPVGTNLFIYKDNYPAAQKIFNLEVSYKRKLRENLGYRNLNFKYNFEEYSFKIPYHKSVVELYKTYPLSEMSIYFKAKPNSITAQALKTNLGNVIREKNMNEVEAANFLLRFAQTAFAYKTDGEQFRQEKPFFVDEIFHYPYSDCEDRSVLYAHLVKDILGLEVVALDYPGHIATAVAFKSQIEGSYLMHNNKKFTVCDPTYINARCGQAMERFRNVEAKVISF